MLRKTSKKVNWSIVAAVFAASTLMFSTLASANTALAQADGRVAAAKLKAIPKHSLVDDGNSQLLKVQFGLETGNFLESVRVTVDPGTPNEQVLVFDSDGTILSADSAFQTVFGSVILMSDGYAIGPANGRFIVAMDKTLLGEGTHEATAEVVLDVGTLTASDEFSLLSSDLVLSAHSGHGNSGNHGHQ